MKNFFKLLPVFLICLSLVACKGKTLIKEETAGLRAGEHKTEVVPEEGVREGVKEGAVGEENLALGGEGGEVTEARIGALHTVYFDFDKYNIRDEDKELLSKNAKWLRLNPGVNVRLEGNADERGENEYNLALGEKRAMSVKTYLVRLGINGRRVSVISYGEERPADPGHNEEAWAKNRRVDFKKIK